MMQAKVAKGDVAKGDGGIKVCAVAHLIIISPSPFLHCPFLHPSPFLPIFAVLIFVRSAHITESRQQRNSYSMTIVILSVSRPDE
jgi:hypothetical protein